MKITQIVALLGLLCFGPWHPLNGETIMELTESGTRESGSWKETSVARITSKSVRVEVSSVSGSSDVTFQYDAKEKIFTIVQKDNPEPFEITPEILRQFEERAKTAVPDAYQQNAQDSPELLNASKELQIAGMSCSVYILRTEGFPDKSFCLADPVLLGFSEEEMSVFLEMSDVLLRFSKAMKAMSAERTGATFGPDDSLNIYRIPQGFPIKSWRTVAGEVTWTSELTKIR